MIIIISIQFELKYAKQFTTKQWCYCSHYVLSREDINLFISNVCVISYFVCSVCFCLDTITNDDDNNNNNILLRSELSLSLTISLSLSLYLSLSVLYTRNIVFVYVSSVCFQ